MVLEKIKSVKLIDWLRILAIAIGVLLIYPMRMFFSSNVQFTLGSFTDMYFVITLCSTVGILMQYRFLSIIAKSTLKGLDKYKELTTKVMIYRCLPYMIYSSYFMALSMKLFTNTVNIF